MTQQAESVDRIVVRSGGGEARWWGDSLAVLKATAADTRGRMTILEMTDPPGSEAPLHVHHREDEAFWILEGSATFEIGGETVEAAVGDYLFGPLGVPHRYTSGPDGCRILFILTPAGFEELVRAVSRPAEGPGMPPPMSAPPSDEERERIRAAIAAHGCEVVS